MHSTYYPCEINKIINLVNLKIFEFNLSTDTQIYPIFEEINILDPVEHVECKNKLIHLEK